MKLKKSWVGSSGHFYPIPEAFEQIESVVADDYSKNGILIRHKTNGRYWLWCAGAIQSIDQSAAEAYVKERDAR